MSNISDQASQYIGEYLNLSGTINVSEYFEDIKYYMVLLEIITLNESRFDNFCKMFGVNRVDKTPDYASLRITEESLKKFLIWYKLS